MGSLVPRGPVCQVRVFNELVLYNYKFRLKTFRIQNETTINKNHIKIRFRSCFADRYMIGVFESKFLLVTIICSVPILSVLTVKIMNARRSLGYKLNNNVRTRTCNYSEFSIFAINIINSKWGPMWHTVMGYIVTEMYGKWSGRGESGSLCHACRCNNTNFREFLVYRNTKR